MPHLSKRKLNPQVEIELIDSLEYILSHSKPDELKKILSSLLSKTERLMMAKRLGVVLMIQEQVSATEIDNILKVTRSTIEKIEMKLETKLDGFLIALKKLGQRKTEIKLKTLLLGLTKYAVESALGKTPTKLPGT
ncbi:MAG: Uncharacterized protein G01um10145_812 [Microgenomates group bacterium Gr01-1014_5]|nr:MAG: Uncharacterized protein G01um10145_812 [Microgenomates group bacterium Gr01-1014_5]